MEIAGGWLKCISWQSKSGIIPLFVGSIVQAAAHPLYLNAPSQVASQWFGANEIGFATNMGILAYSIGALIGFIVPELMVDPDSAKYSQEELFQKVYHYNIMYNVFCSLLILPGLFFKERPLTPPS